jgi:uracil-DNA glycosylase family 4
MYGDGAGFVPDELVEGADTAILMQNPGEEEELEAKPAVGKSGRLMNVAFLPKAGLERGKVTVANVLKCRWLEPNPKGDRIVNGERCKATNKLPPTKVLNAAMQHCMKAHLRLPQSTERVILQGALALKASGNRVNITGWRGYEVPLPMAVETTDASDGR